MQDVGPKANPGYPNDSGVPFPGPVQEGDFSDEHAGEQAGKAIGGMIGNAAGAEFGPPGTSWAGGAVGGGIGGIVGEGVDAVRGMEVVDDEDLPHEADPADAGAEAAAAEQGAGMCLPGTDDMGGMSADANMSGGYSDEPNMSVDPSLLDGGYSVDPGMTDDGYSVDPGMTDGGYSADPGMTDDSADY
ncbi:hypothetical protein [Saccharopolyspora shandongensis]|uniref:hypothetical protein n=1 Tax=Saccharopolyspora shandongensis TaxID=418495 RepID=UPI0033CA5221